MDIVYLNGEYMPENEAKVSIFDRGFVLGDGIYEVLPVIKGKLVDKADFWDRFTRSLGEIELKNPFSKEECFRMLNTLLEKNSLQEGGEGGVYMQVTRGVAKRDFRFLEDLSPTCMAFCYEAKVLENPLAKTGVKVTSVEDIRWKRRDIKSISLLAQCKAKTDAYKKGGYEGIMVEDGVVSEGASSTVYMVKDGVVITTPSSNQILPGIRRKNLIDICDKLNINMEFRHFSIEEMKNADECFLSAATLLVLPISQVDEAVINGGKVGEISTRLREEYKKKVLQEANEG